MESTCDRIIWESACRWELKCISFNQFGKLPWWDHPTTKWETPTWEKILVRCQMKNKMKTEVKMMITCLNFHSMTMIESQVLSDLQLDRSEGLNLCSQITAFDDSLNLLSKIREINLEKNINLPLLQKNTLIWVCKSVKQSWIDLYSKGNFRWCCH